MDNTTTQILMRDLIDIINKDISDKKKSLDDKELSINDRSVLRLLSALAETIVNFDKDIKILFPNITVSQTIKNNHITFKELYDKVKSKRFRINWSYEDDNLYNSESLTPIYHTVIMHLYEINMNDVIIDDFIKLCNDYPYLMNNEIMHTKPSKEDEYLLNHLMNSVLTLDSYVKRLSKDRKCYSYFDNITYINIDDFYKAVRNIKSSIYCKFLPITGEYFTILKLTKEEIEENKKKDHKTIGYGLDTACSFGEKNIYKTELIIRKLLGQFIELYEETHY